MGDNRKRIYTNQLTNSNKKKLLQNSSKEHLLASSRWWRLQSMSPRGFSFIQLIHLSSLRGEGYNRNRYCSCGLTVNATGLLLGKKVWSIGSAWKSRMEDAWESMGVGDHGWFSANLLPSCSIWPITLGKSPITAYIDVDMKLRKSNNTAFHTHFKWIFYINNFKKIK